MKDKGFYRYYEVAGETLHFIDNEGPYVKPVSVMAALDPSPHYPPTRVSIGGGRVSISMTVRDARQLVQQLEQAIRDVEDATRRTL